MALDYIRKEFAYHQADKTSKMISGLITYLRNNEARFKQKKQEKPKKPDKPKKWKNSTTSPEWEILRGESE